MSDAATQEWIDQLKKLSGTKSTGNTAVTSRPPSVADPKRSKVGVGGGVSKDGITFAISMKKIGTVKWFEFKNFTASFTAKPTKSKAVENTKDGTSGDLSVDTGGGKGGIKRDTKNGGVGADEVDNSARVKAGLLHKFNKSPVFIAGALSAGTDGGSSSLSIGGAWPNHKFTVGFTIIGVADGGDEVDVKIMTATPSYSFNDIWVDPDGGMNWDYKVDVSIDIGPNKPALLKEIGVQATKAGIKKIGGAPFVFLEGGYKTLEAAYKNIVAGKELPKVIDKFNDLGLEAGRTFVQAVITGQPKGTGGSSGIAWFKKAYAVTKKEHPEMSEAEFRAALNEGGAKGWREDAAAQIAYQVKGFLYRQFTQNPPGWAHDTMFNDLKTGIFKDNKPPEAGKGLGVKVPTIVDRGDQEPIADVEFLDDDSIEADSGPPIPPAIRGEVQHRVRTHQLSGPIEHGGVTYQFKYVKARKHIEVFGTDGSSAIVPYNG